ncbi:uncharacterized protein LOC115878796 [Sitophilus oryzae]|uniref:Uncharacterized protein LOC115878796 n=1 Tax=Sitophilus oryzae TaxID=7048 RepID=A0A6J2XJ01_SITOR|nr:uncharacterized protein LOC115878796 [Sitophilus oryzae]
MSDNTTSDLFTILILILSIPIINSNKTEFCSKPRTLLGPKGTIETNEETVFYENCSWTISTPHNSVIYINLIYIMQENNEFLNTYDNQTNCFSIKSPNNETTYMNLCSNNYTDVNTVSIPTNEVKIDLELAFMSIFMMTYRSYIVNTQYSKLKCSKSRLVPRRPEDVCINGMLFHNLSCGVGSVSCGHVCYNLEEQQCDDILNCPNGQDEIGCYPKTCPNEVLCQKNSKCIETNKICDEKNDCGDYFDESNCPNHYCTQQNCYTRDETKDVSYGDHKAFITTLVILVLLIIFFTLLSKCLLSRDHIRNVLNNPLEIPLPPFTGPDEDLPIEDDSYEESDFKPGGEVFERFYHNLDKIRYKRNHLAIENTAEIIQVAPAEPSSSYEKYFKGVKPVLSEELAALATLKISRDRCRGLLKAKSEEKPFTKLLFIDRKDDEDSNESDEDVSYFTNPKKDEKTCKKAKSDGEQYIKRKHEDFPV